MLKTTQCLNGGICYENGHLTTCMCPKGFSGPRCQYGKSVSNYLKSPWSLIETKDIREQVKLTPPDIPKYVYFDFIKADDKCRINNGGCEKECCNMNGGYYCRCPPGYRLAPDQRRCLGNASVSFSLTRNMRTIKREPFDVEAVIYRR